jgi:ribosomal protein L11
VPLGPDQRRFYFTKGVQPDLFQPPIQPEGERAFLCEGETDTMRLWQETGGTVPIYGIGGINTWPRIPARTVETLKAYKQVFVIMDNDDDYMVKRQVDDAWRAVRATLDRAKRVHLPHDVKDVCEFFDRYDASHLTQLTRKMSVSRFKPVDFSVDPPPVHWLLKDWIAMGDVTILAGKGGLGKSLVLQALAAAILKGDHECIGQNIEAAGNVLLVDEENPVDVVYSRMLRFGLDPTAHAGKLRYLWNQHVRLDRDTHTLLDEALDYKPVLIGLDSLTRMHTVDENSNAEISALFNDAITPLARETGAAVVLIHHHDKGGNGSRGAGDIVNAADAAIDIHDIPGQANQFIMRINKSRRKPKGAELHVGIRDNPDGTLELVVRPPIADMIF